MASIKDRIKDLIAQCDGEFSNFRIDFKKSTNKGFVYDTEDNDLEGIAKVVNDLDTNKPVFRVYLNKMNLWIISDPIDVLNLDDPSERKKILEVMVRVHRILKEDSDGDGSPAPTGGGTIGSIPL